MVPAFFGLFLIGQAPLKLPANDGFIEGSMSCVALKLRILLWKEEQWENPRVCPPTYMCQLFLEVREYIITDNGSWDLSIYLKEPLDHPWTNLSERSFDAVELC